MGGMKSLVDYASDPLVSITVMLLIIAGGLGFIVWQELGYMLKRVLAWLKKESKAPSKTDLSLHTRLVLRTSFWLIIIPTFIIAAIEWNNPGTLGKLDLTGKILASVFQAVTPRTAGFSTINIGNILAPTAILIAFLMFVGGSPGGTAGGIKTTTFVTVLAYLKSFMASRKRVTLLNRTIPEDTVNLAVSITLLQLGLATISMFLLSITEHGKPFLAIFFETFSALGTVGLSRGITPSLSPLGKIIIIFTMFAGRVGIISILAGYIFTPKKEYYSLPEDDIAVS
jgi:trk system potassium uptake protein TrkH